MQKRRMPRSPNIQIYRPQLTLVLSIVNRVTGVMLSVCALILVVWLFAAAVGPGPYDVVQDAIGSWLGQVLLAASTLGFFLHFCGGIRHLFFDAVQGYALRSIYRSGWTVVAASAVLTVLAWVIAMLLRGS
jgi:succinate dehydrogenase cytochrome b subunit